MAIWTVGQGKDRDERPGEPQFGATHEFLAGILDVVHVQHADALEPVGRSPAEVRDPRVVGAAKGREQLAIRQAVPEEALARLKAGAPNAVHLELLEHGVGLVRRLPDVLPQPEKIDGPRVLEPPARLDHRSDRPDAPALEVPGVILPADPGAMALDARSPGAELWLDPALVKIRG